MLNLDPLRLALAAGVLCSASMFIFTLIALLTGYGLNLIVLLKNIYIGYDLSVLGSIIGGLYGFLEGFICMYLFALIYNILGPEKKDR